MNPRRSTPANWLWLLPVLALLLAACGGATPSAAPPTGGAAATAERLRVAITNDENSLTPYTYDSGFPGWNLLMLQYDSLFQLDEAGTPQPWLVTEYNVSDDGLVYTLDLRQDVTWHDGQPFTANDVVFSFDYYLANSHPRWTANLGGVTSTVAESDYRVVITRESANPSFILRSLADTPILPAHVWEAITDPANQPFEGTNVGTGPYRLVELQPAAFYRFEANPDYFLGAPAVGELNLVLFADVAGTLAALRAGEVDMIAPPVAPEQVESLEATEGLAVIQGPEFTTDLLNFDVQQAPFDNVAVRQAIALAIDRQDLVDTVYLGAATVGSAGWIHPASPAFNPAVQTVHDPDQARSLLDEAGFTDSDGDSIREFDGQPMTFDILVDSGDPLALREAELITEMLAEVGIATTVNAVEGATWIEAVWPGYDNNNGRNYQMAMFGWSAPVQVDAARLVSLIHTDTAIAPLNLTGYSSARADDLSDQILTEADAAARDELIREAQLLIAEEVPFITLLYPDGAYAFNETVYSNYAFIAGQGVVNKLSFLPAGARP